MMATFDEYLSSVDGVISDPSSNSVSESAYQALVNALVLSSQQPTEQSSSVAPAQTAGELAATSLQTAADALVSQAESSTEESATSPTGFCQQEQRVSTHVCNSLHPAVAFDPLGRRGVFWHDNRDGTWEIYGRVLSSQMGARAIQEAKNLNLSQERPVNVECSGFSGAYGGPTSPSGVIDLAQRCASDDNANSSLTSDVAARLAQGMLDVNVSSQTVILSTEADVDFYVLGVTSGTGVRIDSGTNSGQQFVVQRVLAPNVLDLGYKPTVQSDSNFVFSILNSQESCDAMACEFRLTCDLETSMYPDVVSDSSGRFHVVWQSRSSDPEKKWQLWYSQVYPKSIGPITGCTSRRSRAQGGFAPVPPSSMDAVRVLVGGSAMTFSKTGDIGDYFAYGDPDMSVPSSQGSDPSTRTGSHVLYLDTGALGEQQVITYEPETPPSPVPQPPQDSDVAGLSGEYFSDVSLNDLATTRIDPTINFNWGPVSPYGGPTGSPFSARWTGKVKAEHSENYKFYLTTSDGGRMWVNGTLHVDMWSDHGPVEKSTSDIPMLAGESYDIKVEYYSTGGQRAQAILKWSSPSTTKDVVPQSRLIAEVLGDAGTPTQLPPGSPQPAITSSTTTISSTTGLWTGLSLSEDRSAWDLQAAALGITTSPPYVSTSDNVVSGIGDFGQRYEYENVGIMFQSPPDKSVRMRRLFMPVFPKVAPLNAPEPNPASQSLVPAPRRPLPPTFIDPVDISRVVQESQVRYEDGPTRFTLEGDATGTIYTNVFVNDPAGEWLRLVFQKQPLEGEYKFILGRLACGDDPCALIVSGGSSETSNTYDFTLTIYRGPDYRIDPSQLASARVGVTKVYEEVYSFEPGEDVSIYSFPKDKLTLAAGYMYFATLTPPSNFIVAYKGGAPGNVVWSITDDGFFDQYYVPWTLPPFKGLFTPVFYDGYLGSITEGGGESGSVVSPFTATSAFSIGDPTQMDFSPPIGKIILGTAGLVEGELRTGISGAGFESPSSQWWGAKAAYESAANKYEKFWIGGPLNRTYANIIPNPWPWYPGGGRWVYTTNDLSEIQAFNEFFSKIATFEEPPQGTCCWIPIAQAPKTTQPGHPEWSAIFVVKRTAGWVGWNKHWNVLSAAYVPTATAKALLETLDGVSGSREAIKTVLTDLTGIVQRAIPFCSIQQDAGGFVAGNMYVASKVPGQIIRVTSTGIVAENPWSDLAGASTVMGVDHLDGDVFAATASGGLWKISSGGTGTMIARAPVPLISVLVVPEDSRYGALSKKVIASSDSGVLYAFDQETGAMTSYDLGVPIRAFDVCKAGYPLYAIDANSKSMFKAGASNFSESDGTIFGVSASGTFWAIGWNGSSATATNVGSMTSSGGLAILATDILFAPEIGDPGSPEIVCDNQYNATMPFQLTTDGDNVHPRMESDEFDNIWLTWHGNRSGADEVYVARYNGDCGSWSVPTMGGSEIRVSNHGRNGKVGRFPNVTVDRGGDVHLVWQSNDTGDGKWDVFYARSTGGGKKFMPAVRLTDSPGNAMMPDVAINYAGNAERITAVWHDDRFGDFEIMAASKYGAAWRSSAQRGGDLRITGSFGDSLFPRVSADKNQNLRVAWHDKRMGENRAAIFMATYVSLSDEWYSSGQGGKDMLLSGGPQNSLFPDIDTDPAGGLGPVWHDDRHAMENVGYHEEIYSLYCLRQGEAVGGEHFQPIGQAGVDTNAGKAGGGPAAGAPGYVPLDVNMAIVDPETKAPIRTTESRNVALEINAPGAMFWRGYNEDGVLSAWAPFGPGSAAVSSASASAGGGSRTLGTSSGYDLDTMIVPWTLTAGNGKKTVSIQIQDEFNVSYPVSRDVFLVVPESRFNVEFFKDEALTQPLPTFKGWPITTTGDVYLRITTEDPQEAPPTFDVIERGSYSVFNQETAALDQGASASSSELGNGVTGYEGGSSRSFKGRFRVYRDDGVFHVDGLARVIVRAGVPSGNSQAGVGGNQTPPPTA